MTKYEIIRNFLELAEATSPENIDTIMKLMGRPIEKVPPIAIYLTQKKLASILGFNPTTLYRWQVPCHDIGGCRRYVLSEVQAYLSGPEIRDVVARLRNKRLQERQKIRKKGKSR